MQNTDNVKKKTDIELIIDAFKESNYKGFFIKDIFTLNLDGEIIAFRNSLSSRFSFYAKRLLDNPYRRRTLLKKEGFSISEGEFFKPNNKEEALNFAREHNMQVQLEYRRREKTITSIEEFEQAWKALSKRYKRHQTRKGYQKKGILITRNYQEEVKSRYLIIEGKCVGVIQYTVAETGEIETINITPYVHPNFIEIAEKVTRIVVGMDILAVDIVAKDHLRDPYENGYAIFGLEVKPSINEFHYPTYGESLNIAKMIVDNMIDWVSRKKQLNNLLAPVKDAKPMPELVLNRSLEKISTRTKTHNSNKKGLLNWLKGPFIK
ncbi:MAG: hypothetical protein GX963_06105 [Bacteroidales bacterium]|nr:hypothetical protein [Bacteroidales bacterium]